VRTLRLVLVAGFALAAAYHALALAWPAPAFAGPSPAWRHALFVGVNAVFAAGFARPPRWFPAAVGLLGAQQVASHGSYALATWRAEGRVDWASVVVLLAVPLAIAFAVVDARSRVRPASR
jgi:hypothetical protein